MWSRVRSACSLAVMSAPSPTARRLAASILTALAPLGAQAQVSPAPVPSGQGPAGAPEMPSCPTYYARPGQVRCPPPGTMIGWGACAATTTRS